MSTGPDPGVISTDSLTYEEAITALFEDARFDGRAPRPGDPEARLQRMRAVLAELGSPHERFRTIHITGTKGKGSTSAFTESILRHLGYRTGLFTSPHLHSFRERIRVQGRLISRRDCADLIQLALPSLESYPDLTFFGRITVLAFLHFARANVDWAVVEVGVGGRLDSTNVISPAVCGITHVSLDHMHILGDSIEEIAGEKAGIIKKGTPVYCAPQKTEADKVVRQVAAEKDAPLTVAPPYEQGPLPLVGRHQRINAGIALGMVQNLHDRGLLDWDIRLVERGLSQTRWPCRIEWLPLPEKGSMPLVVDCAHNRDSLEILLSTLSAERPGQPYSFVFGVSRDKNIEPMLRKALEGSSRIVLVQSRHPKSMPAAELRSILQQIAPGGAATILCAPSMAEALRSAQRMTPPGGYVVGTGSVFVAAELREAWNEQGDGLFPAEDWIHEAGSEPMLTPLPPGYGAI